MMHIEVYSVLITLATNIATAQALEEYRTTPEQDRQLIDAIEKASSTTIAVLRAAVDKPSHEELDVNAANVALERLDTLVDEFLHAVPLDDGEAEEIFFNAAVMVGEEVIL